MIKNNQNRFNRLHVIIDGLAVVFSYLLAYFMKFIIITDSKFQSDPLSTTSIAKYIICPLLAFLPGLLILYAMLQMYAPKRVMGRKKEYTKIVVANLAAVFAFLAGLYIFDLKHFSRSLLFYFFAYNTCITIIERCLIRMALANMRRRGYNQKHVLLVGYSNVAKEMIDRILENPSWGYHVYGILDDMETNAEYRGIKVIGKIDRLPDILSVNQLDEVMITLRLSEYEKLVQIVASIEKFGIHTKFIPDYCNVIPTIPYIEDFQGLPVINIRHVPLTSLLNRTIKRTFDIIGSLLAIILFSPIMLICAALVKLTSKGPVIFCQERVGLHNLPFKMYKFRSMTVQTDEEEMDKWTKKGDVRVTGIGGFMRKTSLDELPQLFNVLKGEMSLIGPRPERPFFVEKFKNEIPRYMVKHQVRPGMTGWAQVNGYRGDTSIKKRIDCDLYYIENWSLGLDLKIMVMTLFVGFVNKNAY